MASSVRQAAGCCPRIQYSHGRARSAARPALTPRVYASSTARCSGTCLGDHLPRDSAEPEKARLAILLERHRTEQFRELPGREAPREVHLEEAILGVEEAGGEGKIAPIGGLDRRHAARIAGDAYRGGELGLSQLPVEPRQRAAQAQVGAQQERKQQQRAQHAEVLQLSHARVFGLASPA